MAEGFRVKCVGFRFLGFEGSGFEGFRVEGFRIVEVWVYWVYLVCVVATGGMDLFHSSYSVDCQDSGLFWVALCISASTTQGTAQKEP